ncbi:hypothetical protein ACOME3_006497 [Neoechinorhynchus agilis]
MASSLLQQAVLKRASLKLDGQFNSAIRADNWLEHEQQPTDSELESIRATVHANQSRDTSDDEAGSLLKEPTVINGHNRLFNSIELVESFRAMGKNELKETMKTLRALYKENFGSDEDTYEDDYKKQIMKREEVISKLDKDIQQIREKLEYVCLQQKELRTIGPSVGEERNSSFCSNDDMASTSLHDEEGYEDEEDDENDLDGSDISRKLLSYPGLASPLPLAYARRQEFCDQRMEQRRTERERLLMMRQMQRKENMLQRRIQRETTRRLLEEEERQEMELSSRRKADDRMKRDLILNFHKAAKDEARTTSRYDLAKPTSVARRSRRLDEALRTSIADLSTARLPRANEANKRPWDERQRSINSANSSYMSPTTSYRIKVNRASSVNSLLALNGNPDEDEDVYGSLQSPSAVRSFLSFRQQHQSTDAALAARSMNELNTLGNPSSRIGIGDRQSRQFRPLNRAVSSSMLSETGRQRSLSRIPLKNNRTHIINALTQVALAGSPNKRQRDIVLKEIEDSTTRHLMILFRDHRLQYRGLYSFSGDSNFIEKIHGIGPNVIEEINVEKFYKYNSCTKSFALIPAKHFSMQTDGLILKDDLWHGSRKPSLVRSK